MIAVPHNNVLSVSEITLSYLIYACTNMDVDVHVHPYLPDSRSTTSETPALDRW